MVQRSVVSKTDYLSHRNSCQSWPAEYGPTEGDLVEEGAGGAPKRPKFNPMHRSQLIVFFGPLFWRWITHFGTGALTDRSEEWGNVLARHRIKHVEWLRG